MAAVAAFVIASGAMAMPASAADLDFFEPAPPPFVPTWQGFYFGGHIGYGEADVTGRSDLDFFDGELDLGFHSFRTTVRPDGVLGGVQAGYNWQSDSLVFGLEGDISFTDWSGRSVLFDSDAGDFDPIAGDESARSTLSADVDFLASIRGRVGFAADSLLIYGTGGIAWADAQARSRVHVVEDGDVLIDETRKTSLDDVGFVVGAGLGWMVIPQAFSLGVEGLYYFFDRKKTLFDDPFEIDEEHDVHIRSTAKLDDVWVIRLRGDLHF